MGVVPAVVRRQYAVSEALDAKLTSVLSAGSVLLGISAFSDLADAGALQVAFLTVAALAWAALAWAGLRGLWPRQYFPLDNSDKVLATLEHEPPDRAMQAILRHAAEAYAENAPLNERKADLLHVALIALVVEVTAVVGAFFAAALG